MVIALVLMEDFYLEINHVSEQELYVATKLAFITYDDRLGHGKYSVDVYQIVNLDRYIQQKIVRLE